MAAIVDVSDSQRLIAVSLGKIAASRSQRGGINLHKNLLVATVLHKARTAYMMEHFHGNMAARLKAQQQQAMTAQQAGYSPTTGQQPTVPEQTNNVVSAPTNSTSPSLSAPLASVPYTSRPEVSRAETGSASDNADVSRVQVAGESGDDKENTPPASPTPLPDSAPSNVVSTDCEMRLHQDNSLSDLKDKSSSAALSHAQQTATSTRDYVSSGNKSCSSCVLKRRRTADRDNENVVAPKVRILECRITAECVPEPMQCESPQISNLVNIFNTGFSGLCPADSTGNTDSSSRSHVGQLSSVSPILSSHKLSTDSSMLCGQQLKACMDSVPQAIALTV